MSPSGPNDDRTRPGVPKQKAAPTSKQQTAKPATSKKAAKQQTAKPATSKKAAKQQTAKPATSKKAAKQQTAKPATSKKAAKQQTAKPATSKKAAKQTPKRPAAIAPQPKPKPPKPKPPKPKPPKPKPPKPKPPKPKPPEPGLPTSLPGRVSPGEIVAIGRQDLLAQAKLDELLDPKTLKAVLERLEPLIEIEPVEPGATLPVRLVDAEAFATISATAAIDAAGLEPPTKGDRDVSVVWAEGDAELLVHVADVTSSTGDGFIDVTIPVECDQTGRVDIVVTLVTAHPDRPFGAVLATTHHPHGPRAVVDRWSEALIAFAWSIVATSASLIAGSAGRDREGRQLSPTTLVASEQGLSVVPMAEHRFTAPSARERVSTTPPSIGKAAIGKAAIDTTACGEERR